MNYRKHHGAGVIILKETGTRAGLAMYENNADVVVGCESHLDHTNLSGGAFIAFRNHLTLIEQPFLSGEAEMIWAKFQVDNKKVNYICDWICEKGSYARIR